MTKPTPLHNADLIYAAADGHQMQVASLTFEWRDTDTMHALHLLATQPAVDANFWVRIKPDEPPRTITINGHTVPEPMQHPPAEDEKIWLVDLTANNGAMSWHWVDCELGTRHLRRGICHTTRAAAVTHASALVSFTRHAPAQ